jgi:hypothetical protein
MDSRTPLGVRSPAFSLATIASMLAPTMNIITLGRVFFVLVFKQSGVRNEPNHCTFRGLSD